MRLDITQTLGVSTSNGSFLAISFLNITVLSIFYCCSNTRIIIIYSSQILQQHKKETPALGFTLNKKNLCR